MSLLSFEEVETTNQNTWHSGIVWFVSCVCHISAINLSPSAIIWHLASLTLTLMGFMLGQAQVWPILHDSSVRWPNRTSQYDQGLENDRAMDLCHFLRGSTVNWSGKFCLELNNCLSSCSQFVRFPSDIIYLQMLRIAGIATNFISQPHDNHSCCSSMIHMP